jgi:hypothetical protein
VLCVYVLGPVFVCDVSVPGVVCFCVHLVCLRSPATRNPQLIAKSFADHFQSTFNYFINVSGMPGSTFHESIKVTSALTNSRHVEI